MRLLPFAGPLLILLLISLSATAQDFQTNYKPERKYRPSKAEIEAVGERFTAERPKGYVKETWEEKHDYLVQLDSSQRLMSSDTLTAYVERILQRIKMHNPTLRDIDTRVWISRNTIPNASSHGEGLLLVHLGLLNVLESESQLAFILAHELAHEYREHVDAKINAVALMLKEGDYKREMTAAHRQKFNTSKAMEEVLHKYQRDMMKHSQSDELEADSLGFIFYVNAGYAPHFAVQTVLDLDSMDYPQYSYKLDYSRFFRGESKTFDTAWLAGIDGDVDLGTSKRFVIPDSMKTHPDCRVRHAAVTRIAAPYLKVEPMIISPIASDYAGIRAKSEFETIEYGINRGFFDWVMFRTLQMLHQYPDNLYLKCALAHSMIEIYTSRVDHRFSYLVDFPDKKFPPAYNQHLAALHNISSSTMLDFTKSWYKREIEAQANSDAYAGFVRILLSSLPLDEKQRLSLAAKYKGQHRDAHFAKLLTEKFGTNSHK